MKRWLILVGIVVVLIVAVGGAKALQLKKMFEGFASAPEPEFAVSTLKAGYQTWQPELSAAGSTRAVRGVDLSTEIDGLVQNVSFRSGAEVAVGTKLLQLRADADVARLAALQAELVLAESVVKRDRLQRGEDAISQAQLDSSEAAFANARAAHAEQAALVAKKTIVAPFGGRLGISTVNSGQYLKAGDVIVSIQQLDPIYVDFNLPQKALAQLKVGQPVHARSDSFPGVDFSGEISAINPSIDTDTRNVQVQATLKNPEQKLLPGMFATVNVISGEAQRYLTLPQTAVTFNPYGETVYVIVPRGAEKAADPNTPKALQISQALDAEDAKIKAAQAAAQAKAEGKEAPAAAPAPAAPASAGPPVMVARQVFVTVGATRGDQVAVLSGIKEGDEVVTSGQLKLKTGVKVAVNNTVVPANDAAPKPVDE